MPLPGSLRVANVSPPARLGHWVSVLPPSAGHCAWDPCPSSPIHLPCPDWKHPLHTWPSPDLGTHLDYTRTESLLPSLQPGAPGRPGCGRVGGLSAVSPLSSATAGRKFQSGHLERLGHCFSWLEESGGAAGTGSGGYRLFGHHPGPQAPDPGLLMPRVQKSYPPWPSSLYPAGACADSAAFAWHLGAHAAVFAWPQLGPGGGEHDAECLACSSGPAPWPHLWEVQQWPSALPLSQFWCPSAQPHRSP